MAGSESENGKSHETLWQMKGRYTDLADHAYDPMIVLDLDGIIRYANLAARDLAGSLSLIGLPMRALLQPEQAKRHRKLLDNRRRGDEGVHSYQWDLFSPDRSRHLVMDVRSSVLKENGKPAAVLVVARDITERQRLEQELRSSEKKYRILLGSAHVGIFQSTLEGRYLYANQAFLKMLGYETFAELEEKKAGLHYADPSARKALIGEIRAEGISTVALEKAIAAKLGEGYIVNPQVTATVKEYKSQRVFVMGEVNQPGTYSVTRENNLLFVLSQAGGPTKEAGEELVVIRPGRRVDRALTLEEAAKAKEQIIQANLRDVLAGDQKNNIAIRDADTVIVSKMPYFFVMGEVKTPGKYNLERGTTVLNAISMGGGLTPLAAPKRTKITREQDGKKVEIPTTMETLVLPGDTIVVPQSFF